MTHPRRLALSALSWLAVAAPATPAAAATVAPGRVVFPLGKTARIASVDPFGLAVGVAQPDGRVTLAGLERGKGVVLVRLLPDGSPDPAFGTAGTAHVAVPAGSGFIGPMPLQLLRATDGGLVLVATSAAASRFELPQLVFVRLTPDGKLDTTFGTGGIAKPGVQGSCANCSPAALQAHGSIVFTGNTGQLPATIEHDPTVKPDFHWVVARLTPAGALDPAFGQQGIATMPGANGTGTATAALADGTIGVLGTADGGPKLARLTITGGPDPLFHGGTPVTPPGSFNFVFGLLPHLGGSMDVLSTGSGGGQVARYTPTGELDQAFGDHGLVAVRSGAGIDELLPAPDGGDIVAGPTTLNPGLEPVALRVTRIAPGGAVTAATDVPVPFGGGLSTVFTRLSAPRITSLRQTGFHAARAFARTDGGLVLPGAVGVVQYTGEGAGYEIERAAVASITPSLALDPAFGGTVKPAKITVSLVKQRASTATSPRLLRVALRATTSGPGLAQLTVKSGKRVIARSTAPVYSTGTQRLAALLTLTGRRTLKHARGVRVTVTATFRDLVGSTATAAARGTLR